MASKAQSSSTSDIPTSSTTTSRHNAVAYHDPASFHNSYPRLTSSGVKAEGGHSHHFPPRGIQTADLPFAGRIGGNQEFCYDPHDESAGPLLEKQPDAAPIISLHQSLRLDGFLIFDYYKMALVEGLGTSLLVFVSGAGTNALTLLSGTVSPLYITLYAAGFNSLNLTLFIYATAPASGGHLNPTITMATFFAGLSSLSRSVLYVVAQCVGAIVGGYWLRLGLGAEGYFAAGVIPGCTVDARLVSKGQEFVLEYVFALATIFLAFGVGLEPRNAKTYGPAFAPVLVGLTLGLGNLASNFVKEGYTGIAFNSARCLGLLTAKGDLQYHWIHWLATLSACIVHGMFYHTVPPYKRDGGKTRREALPCLEHHAGEEKH